MKIFSFVLNQARREEQLRHCQANRQSSLTCRGQSAEFSLCLVLKMIFDKVKKFQVVFDSPDVDCPPVFSSGDVVSGRVVLELSAETKVQSVKLHAEGYAKVHWTESRSAGSSTAYTQNYSDEVEYLNRREVLLQAGQSPYSVHRKLR